MERRRGQGLRRTGLRVRRTTSSRESTASRTPSACIGAPGGLVGRAIDCSTGPGAGPAVTAATILDDVTECARAGGFSSGAPDRIEKRPVRPIHDGWFVRISARRRSLMARDIADFSPVTASGSGACRTAAASGNATARAADLPVPRARLDRALAALADAAGCGRSRSGRWRRTVSSPATSPLPTRLSAAADTRPLSVIKIGGSVPTGHPAYRRAAASSPHGLPNGRTNR